MTNSDPKMTKLEELRRTINSEKIRVIQLRCATQMRFNVESVKDSGTF